MKKYIFRGGFLFLLLATLTGCSANSDVKQSSGNIEQNHTEENQKNLVKNQPPVTLDWSLERENINKRTSLWNDANKISYIYLVNYGKVMAFYTLKGKVSSVNSHITNDSQLSWKCVNADGTYATNEGCSGFGQRQVDGIISSPAEDGSYGTNGDAIFFFTTEGAYVEWAGDYMLADQPLKLTTQPELIREIK